MSTVGIIVICIASVLVAFVVIWIYIHEMAIEKREEESACPKYSGTGACIRGEMSDRESEFKVVDVGSRSSTARRKMKELSNGDDPEAMFYLVHGDALPELPVAVKVIHSTGILMGYVDPFVAESMAPLLDRGEVYICRLHFADDEELWLKFRRIGGMGKDERREFMDRVAAAEETSMNIEKIDKASKPNREEDEVCRRD